MRKCYPLIVVLMLAQSLSGCMEAVVIGAVGAGAMSATDRRSTGTQGDDQAIELKAMTRLSKDADLFHNTNINVISFNRVLLMVGQSPSSELIERAERLITSIPQATRVHNEVRLAAPSAMLTRSSDSWITSKVKSTLVASQDTEAHKVKVITENGEVFLMGLVTKAEGQRAINISRQVKGVQKVFDVFEYIDA